MIPILFESDETNFSHNGLGHLHETVDYEVTEVRNGEFELVLEYPVEGLWYTDLTDFRIILAKPNDTDEEHQFRIYERVMDLEEKNVLVYASTKTNDLGGNLVSQVVISDENPQQALTKMKNALIEPTLYNFVSDIQTTSSTEWIRRNPLNCIAGEEGSLVDYWGGEIKRTNDTIYLYSRRGQDNVTTIQPGKNLEGFEMTVSTKGMITGILPYFKYIPEGETESVTVEGTVVWSPLAGNYPVKYLKPIDFSSDDTIVDLATLNAEAQYYFSYYNPDCDKPKVKIEVDLMQLSDSAEYDKFKSLEHIGLTDTVTVWIEQFDVDVVVKVTEVTYSGMKEMVTKLVAGTPSSNFYKDIQNTYLRDANAEMREYVAGIENGVRNLVQLTADSKNTIFRGYTQPDISISKPKDLWYKDLGSGNVEMFQFDGILMDWVSLKITDAVFADEMSVTKFTAGTLNAELVNLINLNASNITTGTLTGPNFWLNLLTSVMRFIDPATAATLDLNQAKIIFNAGTTEERILEYTSEGLRMRPGPNNTGTNLNTSLRLHGGVTYIDFFPGDGNGDYAETDPRARVETNGEYIYLRTAFGESVYVKDWAGAARDIHAAGFICVDELHPSYHRADRWETPRSGNRSLVISPNGEGRLYVSTPEQDAFYPVWSSAFVVSSSQEFKRNVKVYAESALGLVNSVEITEYDLLIPKGDKRVIDPKRRKDIGMIAEKSIPFTNQNGMDDDGTMIDLYRTVSIQMKAIQELSVKNDALEKRLSLLENKFKGVI